VTMGPFPPPVGSGLEACADRSPAHYVTTIRCGLPSSFDEHRGRRYAEYFWRSSDFFPFLINGFTVHPRFLPGAVKTLSDRSPAFSQLV
jgi:hypothetical protein